MNGFFHLHLVSDSTGETVEKLCEACLAQFENIEVRTHTHTQILRPARFETLVGAIEANPGPVLYTIVDNALSGRLEHECGRIGVPCINVLYSVISRLGHEFGQQAHGLPGRQHRLNADYFHRIEAMQFSLAHDDGQGTERLREAEIVLVGVSRTSKTPTAMYLANHRGLRAANVPCVPGVPLPDILFGDDAPFVVGLTTAAERLVQIRRNRIAVLGGHERTGYVDPELVQREIVEARRLFTRMGWPVIDVSRRSIEETAAEIIDLYNAWREARAGAPAPDRLGTQAT